MTPQDIGAGIAGLGLVAFSAYNTLQTAAAKREARAAAGNTEAVRATLTTNNGGSHVKDSLDRIERRQQDEAEDREQLRQDFRDHLRTSARTEDQIFERLDRLERRPRLLPFL